MKCDKTEHAALDVQKTCIGYDICVK